ncbi:MAG: menaquinone biosynthetic enzyme MqnA/MqnD family protein [Pelotomaculaceae bacterium]|nr:menaquinone biosynthesis protein [Bacillota bacterium]HHU85505.1 menaquinone biosynthesis protein [Peptococcaceae bacterium]
MSGLRLGQVEYINYLPVYYALEEGILPLEAELVKGSPTRLNRLFLDGELEVTSLSSIEYARNADRCLILPDLSISADGRVANILFFSKMPVTELEGKKVCLTETSATSVVLLKILFDHYYHVDVQFETAPSDFDRMMLKADGALLIGDEAILAHQRVKEKHLPYQVTDLGDAWKQFTGEKMVYAIWVVRRDYAEANPMKAKELAKTLLESKKIGMSRLPEIIALAQKKSPLPVSVIKDYFKRIRYEFDESDRHALLTFYNYAYKSGLIEDRVRLRFLGE